MSAHPMCSHSRTLIPLLVVHWTDWHGTFQLRAQAAAPFSAVSTGVHARGESIHTGASGAAFLLMRRSTTSGSPLFSDMSQLRAHHNFPEGAPAAVRAMDIPWVKVEDHSWANGSSSGLDGLSRSSFAPSVSAKVRIEGVLGKGRRQVEGACMGGRVGSGVEIVGRLKTTAARHGGGLRMINLSLSFSSSIDSQLSMHSGWG